MATLQEYLFKYIEKDYKRVLKHIEIDLFKHSHFMYGYTPQDVMQSAVLKLIEYVANNSSDFSFFFDKNGEEIGSENLRGYIFNSLKQNASNCIYDMRRQSVAEGEVGTLVDAIPEVSGVFGRTDGAEMVEHRDVLDSISPSFARVIKGTENGDAVLDIMRKTGIRSVKKFYEARQHLETELELSGFELSKQGLK